MNGGAVRTRDAERSRQAILDAARRMFSEKGFDGCSLSDIGAAAGLSRATPSYFFGSKGELYRAVIERMFAERQEATAIAVRPLRDWAECDEAAGGAELRDAIRAGIDGYLGFLRDNPAFVRLILWEELAGGGRLRSARRDSSALTDAFTLVRAAGRRRGVCSFDVDEAVILWVSITFLPAALAGTFLGSVGFDPGDEVRWQRHVDLATGQTMALLAGSD